MQKLRIRIGEGRYAVVAFPEGLEMAEAARIACALFPHAEDFDWSNERHRRLMMPQEV